MIQEKHRYASTGKQGAFATLEEGVAQGFLIQKTRWVVTGTPSSAIKPISWEFACEADAKRKDKIVNGQAYVNALHAELMKRLEAVKLAKGLCGDTQRRLDLLADYKASYEAEDFAARRFDILKELRKKAYYWLDLPSRISDDLTFDQLCAVMRIVLKARLAKVLKQLAFVRVERNAARHDLDEAKTTLKALENSVKLEQ